MSAWTGVLLAAGMSRRMGQPKLSLPFGGSTIGETCIAELISAGIDKIVVVRSAGGFPGAGASPGWDGRVRTVLNPDPDRGMFSSIQIGVAAAAPESDFLVALADQPMITGGTIRTLLDLFAVEQPAALQPAFGGKRGHPVLFSRRLRDPLLAMPESATLRDLLHSVDVTKVELATDAVLRDIDVPADYARETGRQPTGAAEVGEAVTADRGAHYGRERI